MNLAFSQVPDTDIWLFDLKIEEGKFKLENGSNITNRAGYDNQPFFLDEDKIIYTSIVTNNQADLYEYNINTAKSTLIASTPESEYSPKLIPGGNSIGCVRVEADSTQRLWKMTSGTFELVISEVDSVGYYAFTDKENVFMFILGKTNDLVHYNIKTKKITLVCKDIGRTLYPYKKKLYYLNKKDKTIAFVGSDLKNEILTTLPYETEDFIVFEDMILTSYKTKLLRFHFKKRAWERVFDLYPNNIKNVTRLAVSPNGKRLAIVNTN